MGLFAAPALAAKAATAPATQGATAPASTPAKPTPAAPAPPVKATAQQRAEADRMDPLARAAFWGREADTDPRDPVAGVKL
ncbi:MAG TPA: pilus assembly protein TadD, partial [Caulobacteraceae bacterium]